MGTLIYCVEDDTNIRELVLYALKATGFEAVGFSSAADFYQGLSRQVPDLALLDIMLPDEDGITILKKLKNHREWKELSVIMLTAKAAEYDKVLGLDSGADDYITKPYNPNILILRIQSVLKRCDNTEQNKMYRGFFINKSRCELESGDKVIELTKNEMIIFMCLFDNLGKIVSRDEIMTDLWNNDEYVNDNALTVNISRLRSKLSDASLNDAIETKKGLGYILL